MEGKPQGGEGVYHPFNADCGEDQLYNYVGMLGIPLEPTPFFDEKADSIFLTASACKDPQVMDKLKTMWRTGTCHRNQRFCEKHAGQGNRGYDLRQSDGEGGYGRLFLYGSLYRGQKGNSSTARQP